MRTTALLCAALSLVLSTGSAGAQGNAPGQPSDAAPAPAPRLVIEEFVHDFGELKAGEPLKWVFRISNTGSADLLIKGVKPG